MYLWRSMEELYLFREEGETVSDIDTISRDEEEAQGAKGLICRQCGLFITSEDLSIEVNDTHHHTFFNPAGIIYEIRCFSGAKGCSLHGPPSTEFTWFAGYTWRIALCMSCATHLGWFFSSGDLGFFGLIKKKLSSL